MRFAAILFCCALPAYPATTAGFRAGAAAVKITPPPGMPMGGGFTLQISTGVHDDLFCKAIALESDGRKTAIVSCDVESFHRPTVEAARRAITAGTGLRGEDVMITATHSHSGPEMTPLVLEGVQGETARIIAAYYQRLPEWIAEAVQLAEKNLQPARVWAAGGREDSISFNRRYLMKDGTVRMNPGQRNPEAVRAMGPIDPTVAVAYFYTPQGVPVATQVNFALHTTAFGGREFSSDYPGVLARLLAEAKGAPMLTQFLQGAAGNINQIDVASADRAFGWGESVRIGTILAAAVLKSCRHMEPAGDTRLGVRSAVVKLPVPACTKEDLEHARATVARSRQPGPGGPSFLELVHAFQVINVLERHRGRPFEAEVQVISLGDRLAWVGLPGENFVELGMAVRLASPFRHTLICELANDMFDYFPDRKAFDEGGYEVETARCLPGCGELLVDAARRLLIDAFRGR